MKLHLGCGKRNFGNDWVHVDGGDYPHLHSSDITKLPFEDNSVDLIYASHVIEYFDRHEVEDVLKEWNRVLIIRGVLRVAVPNFSVMSWLYQREIYPLDNFLGPLYGRMDMGDNKIYHKTTYDLRSLVEVLESCRFSEVKEYDWRKTEHADFDDQSQAYLPHMDKENGTLISLNLECVKI